jgi:hypothetical protein
MAPLSGLTGLYAPDPQDTTDFMDEGVLEARANEPAEDHGHYGSQSLGYSGTVPDASPFSGMPVYDGWGYDEADEYGGRGFPGRGLPIDQTPTSHKAPWPRGIRQFSNERPNELAEAGEQLIALHSPDFGGPRFLVGDDPTGHEEPSHYTTDRYDAPNENYLSPDTPGQLKGTGFGNSAGASGHGNADPTQGYGVLNTLPEFQMGHSIRRVQHDSVHFDYTNTHGEQDVPFMGRHPVQQMPLDGPDSPYFEMGNIDGANVPWEGRIGDPSPYEQPAEPTIGEAPVSNDVFAWG